MTVTAPYAATFAGAVAPDLETFRALARDRRVIPVVRRLLADGETPIGLYRKLAGERAGTFLLESAEHGRAWSRYSFVGVRCAAMLTEVDGAAHWLGNAPVGLPTGGDPSRRCATPSPRCTPSGCPVCPRSRAAWSATCPTTSSVAGSGCPTPTPTSSASPSSPCCSRPTSPCSTTTTARCSSSRTPSTTTPPTSASTRRTPTPCGVSTRCRPTSRRARLHRRPRTTALRRSR